MGIVVYVYVPVYNQIPLLEVTVLVRFWPFILSWCYICCYEQQLLEATDVCLYVCVCVCVCLCVCLCVCVCVCERESVRACINCPVWCCEAAAAVFVA